MRDGAVAEAVLCENRILSVLHALAINGEAAAIDLQGCFGPAELQAAVIDGRIHHALVHHIKPGIAESRLDGVGTIPLLENIFVGQHLRLARLVGFHGPVHHIDPVAEQIGHGAAAEIPEPAPMIKFFLAEGLIGSGAEPQLPIECLHVDGFGRPVPLVVLPPIGSHLRDAAETAGLNQIDRIAKVGPTALLHAALQNLLAGTNRAGKCGAFLEGVGDRLFQIDVFAGGQGIDRHANVPVIRRRDEHGIDVVGEHLTIIQVGSRDSVGPFLDGIALRPIDIAHGHDLVRAELCRRHPAGSACGRRLR